MTPEKVATETVLEKGRKVDAVEENWEILSCLEKISLDTLPSP